MLNKILTIVLAASVLISCASRDSKSLEQSNLILTNNLFVQVDHSKIFFQDGGPIRPHDVDEYEPFCSLDTELTSTARTPIEIMADTFIITRIENDSLLGESFTVGGGQKAGARYMTKIALTSKNQPFINSLVCQRWVVGSMKRYLNISDIENILGNAGKFVQ